MKEIKVKLPDGFDIENVTTKIEDGCVVVLCEPKRWRAKVGERYYCVSYDWRFGFDYQTQIEDGDNFDNFTYLRGNYFKTREQAENVAQEIREIFEKHKND